MAAVVSVCEDIDAFVCACCEFGVVAFTVAVYGCCTGEGFLAGAAGHGVAVDVGGFEAGPGVNTAAGEL